MVLTGALTIQNLANPRPPEIWIWRILRTKALFFLFWKHSPSGLVFYFPKALLLLISDSSLSVDPLYPTSILSSLELWFLSVLNELLFSLCSEPKYTILAFVTKSGAWHILDRGRVRSTELPRRSHFHSNLSCIVVKPRQYRARKSAAGNLERRCASIFIVLQILLTH